MRLVVDKQEDLDLTKATHPFICLIHVGLKAASILCYFFMKLVTGNSINTFITVLIINSVDFWFVKNVAGRYLVGLRWWNGDSDEGEEGWVWEHDNYKMKRSDADRQLFWLALITSTVFWLVLGIVKILGLSLFWGMLVVINFFMNFTNLYAYYQCNQEYKVYSERILSNLQKFGRASAQLYNTLTGKDIPGDVNHQTRP